MAKNYFDILEVDSNATEAEIKKAYRRLARKYHPDVNPSPEAAEKFQEIAKAQEALLDPEKRRIVDAGGDPFDPNGGMPGSGAGFGGGFGDIFSAFFGGGMGGAPEPFPRTQPGEDALIRVAISLEEAFAGVRKDITVDTAVLCDACTGSGSADGAKPVTCETCHGIGHVQTVTRSILGDMVSTGRCPRCHGYGNIITNPCQKCSGDGRVKARKDLSVRIPAGIASGNRVRMQAAGEVGPGGGPAGDLYVEVLVEDHPRFERQGADLYVTIATTMVDAALGQTITLEHLDGSTVELEIPAGTQPDSRIRKQELGMPQLRGEGRGELVALIKVQIPTELDHKSKELLEQLRNHRKETSRVHEADGAGGGFFGRLRDKFRGK